MIQQIAWGQRDSREVRSPFARGKSARPIRVIFHSSSFARADNDHGRAIELLRELTKLTAVEAIDTEPGVLPYLEIERCGPNGSIPFFVKDGKATKIESGIRASDDLFEAFVSSTVNSRSEDFDRETAYQDYLVALATAELGYDILITLSSIILGNRQNPWIRFVNVRSPLESVKIIGLLLRTRGGYLFEPMPNYRLVMDRRSIHNELTRHKLLNLSAYIKACAHAERFGAQGLTFLAQSTLHRCIRGLRAHDEIGELFYVPQSDDIRDSTMYHFDYLALLLMGAFDAQARVARRIYGINRPDERNTGFHRKEFLNALKESSANALHDLVQNQYFKDLMDLLTEIRNSIHSSIWPTIGSEKDGETQESFINVPTRYRDKLWHAASRCGSAADWGLIQVDGIGMVLLQPYTFAVNLVANCFRQIDEIARFTDVARLLPPEFDVSRLREKPGRNEPYIEFVQQRVERLD